MLELMVMVILLEYGIQKKTVKCRQALERLQQERMEPLLLKDLMWVRTILKKLKHQTVILSIHKMLNVRLQKQKKKEKFLCMVKLK